MLKTILIPILVILTVSQVFAISIFPTLQDIIDGDYNQVDQTTPNQQPPDQTQDTPEPEPTCNNDGTCGFGENNENCPSDCPTETINAPQQQTPPQNQNNVQTQTREEEPSSVGVIIGIVSTIVFVIFLAIIGFWIHGHKPKKPTQEKPTFGLPQRPKRKFGI